MRLEHSRPPLQGNPAWKFQWTNMVVQLQRSLPIQLVLACDHLDAQERSGWFTTAQSLKDNIQGSLSHIQTL